MRNSKEKILTNKVVVCLLAMLCCVLWGSAFPCIKIGYKILRIDSNSWQTQVLFAGIRFMLAGIMVIIIGSVLCRKTLIPRRTSIGKIFRISMLQTVMQYLFFYVGLAHTTGVKASIIEGMNVFIVIVVASLVYHQEKLSAVKLTGCLLGFAGVVLVNITGNGLNYGFKWNGELFILLSTIAYAFSSIYLKRYSKEENVMTLSGYQFFLGGLIMSVVGLVAGGRITQVSANGILMICYLAGVSAAAYSIWGILLKYNEVSKVAVYGFMNPVFGVLLSAALLGENSIMAGQSIAALILICIGIYIVNK